MSQVTLPDESIKMVQYMMRAGSDWLMDSLQVVPHHFLCSSLYLSLTPFILTIPRLVAIDYHLIFPIILVGNNKPYCSNEHMIILISNYLLFHY